MLVQDEDIDTAVFLRLIARAQGDEMSAITDLHKKLWKQGMGSVSAREAEFLASEIAARRPKLFVELGTATGLSTVLINAALEEAGGGALITVDLNATFFGDKSKATGYLLDEAGIRNVSRVTGKTSLEISSLVNGEKIDMAFIDAAHWHPWPVIDTLMIWPLLKPDAVLFHHDLRLYQKFADSRGIVPKYVYDQFPDSIRSVIPNDPDKNLFYVANRLGVSELGDRMADALYIPWQPPKISPPFIEPIRARLEALYSAKVVEAFTVASKRFS